MFFTDALMIKGKQFLMTPFVGTLEKASNLACICHVIKLFVYRSGF